MPESLAYNKCKEAHPSHPKKSHVVVAKEGDKIKTIRFGQQGVTGDKTTHSRGRLLSRPVTQRTYPKVKCRQPIGLTKLNGKEWLCHNQIKEHMGSLTYRNRYRACPVQRVPTGTRLSSALPVEKVPKVQVQEQSNNSTKEDDQGSCGNDTK